MLTKESRREGKKKKKQAISVLPQRWENCAGERRLARLILAESVHVYVRKRIERVIPSNV